MPLLATLVQQLAALVADTRSRSRSSITVDVNTYGEVLMRAVKSTQLVSVWLRTVSCESLTPARLQLRRTICAGDMSRASLNMRRFVARLDALLDDVFKVTNPSSDIPNEEQEDTSYGAYLAQVERVSQLLGCVDLSGEAPLALDANQPLCRQLSVQLARVGEQEQLTKLLKTSRMLATSAELKLSSFRCQVYTVQNDSLMHMATRLDAIARSGSDATLVSLKFLASFDELHKQLLEHIRCMIGSDRLDIKGT